MGRFRHARSSWLQLVALTLMALGSARGTTAETGYDLWLRYAPVDDAKLRDSYRRTASSLLISNGSPTSRIIVSELQRGLKGLLGTELRMAETIDADGAVVIGTPATSPAIAGLGLSQALDRAGDDGFLIRSAVVNRRAVTVIASRTEVGTLYGTFHFLRLIQTRQPIARLDIEERPRMPRRLLNHWDNLDGSIERGYAGKSLWSWAELPDRIDPRIEDYARANASIGINGTVLNNVNANPTSLTLPYLEKAAALAQRLRPYGIRVYLSANFAAPRTLGGSAHGRSVRAGRRSLVAREGRRDLPVSSPTSAASSSRRTAKGSPGPRTTAGRTQTAPTSSPTPSARTAASSCGGPSCIRRKSIVIGSSGPTWNSCPSTVVFATT